MFLATEALIVKKSRIGLSILQHELDRIMTKQVEISLSIIVIISLGMNG